MDEAAKKFQAFERDGFNEVAAAYAELTADVTAEISGPLLDAARVGSGTAVVDVATGPGWTAAAAAARGATAIGIDISQSMIDEASRRHPGIEFRLGPAEDLPVDSESVDAVVSAFGMPHFADHAAFAAEAHRILRPGGQLAFASWYPPASNPFFAVALGSIAKAGDLSVPLPDGVDMFAWAELEACDELLSAAGFGTCQRVDASLSLTTSDGPGTMVDFLKNASVRSRALYQAQTAEAREAIQRVIEEMLAPMEANGQWTIPLEAFVVHTTKLD